MSELQSLHQQPVLSVRQRGRQKASYQQDLPAWTSALRTLPMTSSPMTSSRPVKRELRRGIRPDSLVLTGSRSATHRFRLDDPWLALDDDAASEDSVSGRSTDADADALAELAAGKSECAGVGLALGGGIRCATSLGAVAFRR